ncbi:MAG: zonular occludens toxin domain-containing protein [Verrucomicrobiota bacterium]
MALTVVDGIMGSGKSYYVVNKILVDALTTTKRPVAVTRNLEINVDNLARVCADKISRKRLKSPLAFQEYKRELLERITWLDSVELDVMDQATGRPLLYKGDGPEREWRVQDEDEGPFPMGWNPYRANQMSEFWYFTKPNSVIIYDEAADRLNSRKWQENMGTRLQAYINHSRHFRDDLYFIAQSYEDLDKQLREKFHTIINVRNSLKSPICQSEKGLFAMLLGGMRWPWQFFIADEMVREGRKLVKFRTHHVRPNKEGFGVYTSFSAPSDMAGKELGDPEGETSEDVGQSFLKRMRPWLERLPSLMMLVGFAAAVGLFVWAAATGRIQSWMTEQAYAATSAPKTETTIEPEKNEDLGSIPAASAGRPGATPEREVAETGEAKPEEETEEEKPPKIIAISSSYVYTDDGIFPAGAVPERLREPCEEFVGPIRRPLLDSIRFVADPRSPPPSGLTLRRVDFTTPKRLESEGDGLFSGSDG